MKNILVVVCLAVIFCLLLTAAGKRLHSNTKMVVHQIDSLLLCGGGSSFHQQDLRLVNIFRSFFELRKSCAGLKAALWRIDLFLKSATKLYFCHL